MTDTADLPMNENSCLERILLAIIEKRGIHVCSSCLHEIDPECCHCGTPMDSHGWYDGHSPIPMGCTCGYHEANKMRGSVNGLVSLAIFGGH